METGEGPKYLSKIYLMLDSIHYRRSNTSLVRVTVFSPGEAGDAAALADAVDFVRAASPSVAQLLAP